MNCRKVLESSGLYIDNELAQPKRKEIEEHLRSCRACRESIEEMRRVDMVSNMEPPPVSEDYWVTFVPRLHQKIFSEGIKKRDQFAWWRAPGFRYALSFTVILIIIGAALLTSFTRHEPELTLATPGVYITAVDKDARIKNYLTNSEIVLIKLVAMPDQKENLKLLKEEVSQAGLIEQIDSNMEEFQQDPQLLNHAKAMEMITIKLLNTDEKNCEKDLQLLKTQVLKSGILEKTQSMKL